MKSWVTSHKFLAIGLLLALALAAVLLVWVETSRAPAPSNGSTTPVGVETTIEGEVVCLPHKDTDGPQTLECAYGIKLVNGTYYGLRDANDKYENISRLPTGKKARLTGTLKEESSDIYQSIGTFTVTSAKVVD
jgi:hypothetical protein